MKLKLKTLIIRSILIKRDIVMQDPMEKGLRKILNYGHTIGHAFENCFLENNFTVRLLPPE